MEDRNSFVVYESFLNAMNKLPSKAKRWDTLMELANYAMYHKEPDMEKLGIAVTIWEMAKPLIDKNTQRWENGKKGGRPKKEAKEEAQKTKPKPNHNQTETKPKPNVYVNANANVNGLDPLTGSKPFNADRETPDGGAPAPAEEPPTAEEIQELKMKLRKEGARG